MMIHQIDSIGSPALRETRIRSALDCVKIFFFEERREPALCSELSCVLRTWNFRSFWSFVLDFCSVCRKSQVLERRVTTAGKA